MHGISRSNRCVPPRDSQSRSESGAFYRTVSNALATPARGIDDVLGTQTRAHVIAEIVSNE